VPAGHFASASQENVVNRPALAIEATSARNNQSQRNMDHGPVRTTVTVKPACVAG
jgi:hypothetical protein